jgi:hypothetical protein
MRPKELTKVVAKQKSETSSHWPVDRRFRFPGCIMIRDREELERENTQVLNLVQAMIGAVTPNMRGVSLECILEGVRLHFLIEREDERDREELEDIGVEFEALQSRGIKLEVVVLVSPYRSVIGDLPGRHVYGRKDWWEESLSEGPKSV